MSYNPSLEAEIATMYSGRFVSTEQTGTGSPQTIAHGLSAQPNFILPTVTSVDAGAALGVAMTSISADAANITITVTSGVKFKVLAMI